MMLLFVLPTLGKQQQQQQQQTKAIREYLAGVYPAGRNSILKAKHGEVVRLFESLEYYYACSAIRGRKMRPSAEFAKIDGIVECPRLPYVPPGAYFRASEPWSAAWSAAASWSRFLRPVEVVTERADPNTFFSSVGSRVGPAPSWTNPMAIVKYALYPLGLEEDGRKSLRSARYASPRKISESSFYEIENFGGPTWVRDCTRSHGVPVCGLWANIYRGTGTFIRLEKRGTLVSRSKATAITEMILLISERDESVVRELARHLGLDRAYAAERTRYPEASGGEALVATMYRTVPFCDHVSGYETDGLKAAWKKWRDYSPSMVVDRILRRRNFTQATDLELDWLLGICGFGAFFERAHHKPFTGFDGFLVVLCCLLGLKAIVLDRSSNDNGLFAQELIDYDTPRIWPTRVESLNPAGRCLQPVDRIGAPNFSKRLPTPEELYDYWTETRKFSLRDPVTNETSTALPCHLAGRRWTKPVDVCRSTLLAQPDPLTPRHNCYLWCSHAISQAHSLIADVHLYRPRSNQQQQQQQQQQNDFN